MSILDVGAGAAAGLEKLLARTLMEDKFAEEQRQARAIEGYRDRSLTESSELRRSIQESNENYRRDNMARQADAQQRDDVRARISLRPIGNEVSSEDYEHEIKFGAPKDIYEHQPGFEYGEVDPRTGYAQSEGQPFIKFKGTATQQGQQETRELRAALDRNTASHRDRMGDVAENREKRLTDWGPPPVQVYNPNMPGGAMWQDRREAIGTTAPPPSPERQSLDAMKQTYELANAILNNYPDDRTWQDALGPMDSALGKAYEYTGIDLGGGGVEGSGLRSDLTRLEALSSFDQAGKNFTGHERQMMKDFLSTYRHQPNIARQRLRSLQQSIGTRMGVLGGTVPGQAGATPPAPGGGGGAAGAVPPEVQQLLQGKPAKRYTLTDGSVWQVDQQGNIKQVQ